MIKKILKLFVSLAVLVLLLLACQTNEIAESEQRTLKEKIEAFSRFESNLASQKSLQKSSSEYVSYHEPFQEIIRTFMNNNPSYEERFRNEAGEIYFNLRSFTYGETKKGLAYPIMKDGIVNAVLIGIVNPERNWVNFTVLKNDSPEVRSMISKFQKFYDAPLATAKGREKIREEQIEEVVINVYESIPGPTYTYYQPYVDYGSSGGLGGGMSGGSTIYHGGGGGNNTNPSGDPCKKMKTQNSNQLFKDKVAELDKKEAFDKKEETGVAAAYGTKPFEPMANTANDNLTFPPGNKYFGYIHTHLDSKEGVVKIFSPADVSTFLTSCVVNAKEKGTMTDAYGMVITSQGNYILKYSGDGNFGIGPNQRANWQTWYEDAYSQLYQTGKLTQPNVEKVFTQFLKEQVNINGLEIYKSEKTTGNTERLEYDGKDKPVKSTPCPN